MVNTYLPLVALGAGYVAANPDASKTIVDCPATRCADAAGRDTTGTTVTELLKPTTKQRFGLKVDIAAINNYGCWCYGGDSWPGAKDRSGDGMFVDLFDDACKGHHMGYDCIAMDAVAEGKICIPNEQTYDMTMKQLPSGDFTLECSNSIETDWCKRRVCMVDLKYLARLWKLEDDGHNPDYNSFGHPGHHDGKGDFDTGVCEVKKHNGGSGGTPPIRVCCGDYPYRIWFDKANNRGVKCCQYEDPQISIAYGFPIRQGKLYNDMNAICCDHGVVPGSTIC